MAKPGKAKVLTDIEFKRLIGTASEFGDSKRNVAILYCAYGLGLSSKELAKLDIACVYDIDTRALKEEVLIIYGHTKQRYRRVMLSNSKVRAALTSYIDSIFSKHQTLSEYSPLFKSKRGGGLSAKSMSHLLNNLYAKAGLTGASAHSARRTFALRLLDSGMDLKSISELMGHQSTSMTARYFEQSPKKPRQALSEII